MLFMVVETFKDGKPDAIGHRFRESGRMMPEDVKYVSSWLDTDGSRCFQLMEAPDVESFKAWTDRWEDLMEFEIVSVLESAEFWRIRTGGFE